MDKANADIRKGTRNPQIDKKYGNMIEIVTKRDETDHRRKVRYAAINASGLQKALDEKGLYNVVSSKQMTAEQVHERYASRDEPEIQFRFVKSQLGYGQTRVQSDASVYARFHVGFVAAILRIVLISQFSSFPCRERREVLHSSSRIIPVMRLDENNKNEFKNLITKRKRPPSAFSMYNYQYKRIKDNEYIAKIGDMLTNMPPFMKSYINAIEGSTAPYTRFIYLQRLNVFFSFLQENNSASKEITLSLLDHLTAEDIEEFTHWIRTGSAGSGHPDKESSVSNYLSALNSLWDYGVTHGKLAHNIISDIKRGKRVKHTVTRLDNVEQQEFFDTVNNGSGLSEHQKKFRTNATVARDKAICLLLIRTGLRVSELVGIDLGDLDMERCCVNVMRKESKTDTVFFSDDAAQALIDYLDVREDLAPAGMDIYSRDTPLFLSSIGSHKGERLTVRSVQRLVKKYAAPSVSGKTITPHKLRATYATDMIARTGDLSLVQNELNHESPSTTALYIDKRIHEMEAHRNDLNNSNA